MPRLAIVLCLLSLVGCSRGKDPEPEKRRAEPIQQVGAAASPKPEKTELLPTSEYGDGSVRVQQEEPAAPPRSKVVKTADMPFRVCALLSGGARGAQAGLAAHEGGGTVIASQGDAFLGYIIEKIEYEEDRVTVSLDGRMFLIELSGADTIVERTVEVKRAQGDGLDLMKIKGPIFIATSEEAAAGIDPNDGATWPENYRGPSIERLMKESEGEAYRLGEDEIPADAEDDPLKYGIDPDLPGTTVESEEDAFPDMAPSSRYTPTENERVKGIDPNDPETWPIDYMGPAIERALKSEVQ